MTTGKRNRYTYRGPKRKRVIEYTRTPTIDKGRKYGWYARRGGSKAVDWSKTLEAGLIPRFIMRRAALALSHLSPERRARAIENVMRMNEGAVIRKQRRDERIRKLLEAKN